MQRMWTPNMSSWDVLYDFMIGAITKNPATYYGFVYSGHSSSWYLIPDPTAILPIVTFGDILEQVSATLNIQLSVVMFDSCLMSMLESLYQLRKVTSYVAAFETYGPWEGFISAQFLSTFDSEEVPIKDQLVAVADNFIERNADGPDIVDVSIIDLSHITTLANIVLNVSLHESDLNDLNDTVDPDDDTHDLYQTIMMLPDNRLGPSIRHQFQTTFNDVVVYYRQNQLNVSESYNPYHHGISVCRQPNSDPNAWAYYLLDLQPVQH